MIACWARDGIKVLMLSIYEPQSAYKKEITF